MEGIIGASRMRLGTALGIVALALGAAGCGGSDGDDAQAERPSGAVVTKSPATTFAPLVHLHARERWLPMSAREFIDYGNLKWASANCSDASLGIGGPRKRLRRDPQSEIASVPTLDPARLGGSPPYRHRPLRPNCFERRPTVYATDEYTRPHDAEGRAPGLPAEDGFLLDLLTERYGGHRDVRSEGSQKVLHGVPVYFERRSERIDGWPALRLTYWMLFGRSEPVAPPDVAGRLRHEGDWEEVSVLVRRRSAPNSYTPLSVVYRGAEGQDEVPWAQAPVVEAGSSGRATHPVVHMARGTHGTYPRPVRRTASVTTVERPYLIREEAAACSQCPRWRTWERLRDLRAQPWYGYGGAWGLVDEESANSGSLGPGPHNRPAPSGRASDRVPAAMEVYWRARRAFATGDAAQVCRMMTASSKRAIRQGRDSEPTCLRYVTKISRRVRRDRRPVPRIMQVKDFGGMVLISMREPGSALYRFELDRAPRGWVLDPEFNLYPRSLLAQWPG